MDFLASLFRCEWDTTRDAPEKPDYFNFGGDDEALNQMLDVLKSRPTMRGISALLCQCIIMLQASKLNVEANRAMSEVLRKVAAFFGDPTSGLLAMSKKQGYSFPTEEDRIMVLKLHIIVNIFVFKIHFLFLYGHSD